MYQLCPFDYTFKLYILSESKTCACLNMPEGVLGINTALKNYSSYSSDSATEIRIFLQSHGG